MNRDEGTPGPALQPEEEPPEQPRTPRDTFPLGRWILLLLVPLVFLLVIVPNGFIVESPGSSFDLQQGVTVQGAQTYSSQGKFLLTSVTIQESSLVYQLLAAFDHDYSTMKETDYLGKNLDTTGQSLVDDVITVISENTASTEGLRQTGKQVSVNPIGAFVVSVIEEFPAYGVLNLGDVIVEADGKPVTGIQDLKDIISPMAPGDSLQLQVQTVNQDALAQQEDANPDHIDLSAILNPGKTTEDVKVASDPTTGTPIIGVALRDYFTYSSDVQVAWNINNVRGPSAGLMMTLSLINTLTSNDLTRAENIAGTGEIFLSGEVGPIGGLPMKIKAAESEGAKVFIYPRDNESDLAGVSTNMQLYPVSNLQEALAVLGGL